MAQRVVVLKVNHKQESAAILDTGGIAQVVAVVGCHLPPYANYRLYKEFVAIGIFLGLDRNLSHHDARHTNATLLVSAGVNMESVSKMMGHSSIKSTQKYAQITVNRISEEMDRLMERRKEKEQQTIRPTK